MESAVNNKKLLISGFMCRQKIQAYPFLNNSPFPYGRKLVNNGLVKEAACYLSS
jgi:hypothetical protein